MLKSAGWMASLDQALDSLKGNESDRAQYLLRRGTMRVGLYAPIGLDEQLAHSQDEIYIVLKGHGVFEKNGEQVEFKANDLLFVEAEVSHRFMTFSSDFATWVVFWGPPGGEARKSAPVAT